MSLQLDARQRAMLEEMGIKLFWPEPEAAAEAVLQAEAAAPVAPAPARTPEPPPVRSAPAPVRPSAAPVTAREDASGLALLQWDPQRGHAPLARDAAAQADWLVVADAVGADSELAAQAGRLLDNMLLALGLTRQDRVVVAHVAAPGAGVQAAAGQLQPRVLLVMGRIALQAALQTTEPLGRLRGRVHDAAGVPAVVTYPPAYLLRNGADKAKAWADLCLARSLLSR